MSDLVVVEICPTNSIRADSSPASAKVFLTCLEVYNSELCSDSKLRECFIYSLLDRTRIVVTPKIAPWLVGHECAGCSIFT